MIEESELAKSIRLDEEKKVRPSASGDILRVTERYSSE
jgi:hypothetical protein